MEQNQKMLKKNTFKADLGSVCEVTTVCLRCAVTLALHCLDAESYRAQD